MDLWSTGHSTPSTDAKQDYTSNFTSNGTHVEFISDRLLNTGDTSQDTIIPLVSCNELNSALEYCNHDELRICT
jgi:hypothetical protein